MHLLWLCLCLFSSLSSALSARINECGNVFTQQQFILESPLYPSNYPLNYQCSYVIKSPCASYVTMEFLDFQLEDSLGCAKDRIEVANRDALCGVRTGTKTYFADKGSLYLKFISDSSISGRGFRILITQQSNCQSTTERDIEIPTTPKTVLHNTPKRCCQPFYNTKQFTLTSPNFPNSLNRSFECSYEIRKSNSNICRLRIQARFFWLGTENDCLQIDNRQFCGCKNDLNLVTLFQGDAPKFINYKTSGLPKNSQSGFVLDVIQDECPKKYTPDGHSNLITWPGNPIIEKLQLVSENTEIDDNVVKHVYIYAPPEEKFYDESANEETCLLWNRRQFYSLGNMMNNCKMNEGTLLERKCVELNYARGYFRSPGYPFYYPANTDICYRFVKLDNSCGIRVKMIDFNLEPSQNCFKDYLQLTNRPEKYCGSALMNTMTEIDLTRQNYQDFQFKTDGFGCARGFYGTYEQIPCNFKNISRPCLRIVEEKEFFIEIRDSEGTCEIVVKPHSRDVCKVRLYFEYFDLVCAYEALILNNMMYCGQLTGQSVVVDSQQNNFKIVYKKNDSSGYNRGLRLRIRGIQDNCYGDVPLERVFISNNEVNSTQPDLSYLIKLKRQYKEICGVVTNSTKVELPETFCDILGRENVTECTPLKNNTLIVPLNSGKLELNVLNVENTTQIQFTEIDCDKI